MGEKFTAFSPKAVEQQITSYLLPLADEDTHGSHALERELVCGLQNYYAPVDHNAALQRVWFRFLTQQATGQWLAQPSRSQARVIHLARWRKHRRLQMPIISPMPARLARYLGIAAIIMTCALALSRLIYVLAKDDTQQNVLPSTADSA